jgi:glycosyltransferase involved in cell wall biosynthesis
VILTTYNENPAFLKTCIDSILYQTYKDFRLYIVLEPNDKNGGYFSRISKDDSRVVIIKNEAKLGISGSRNKAITESAGKYIALIDSDDYCDLKRFEKQLQFLEKNADISVVGSNMILIDSDGHAIGHRTYPEKHGDIKKYFLKTMSVANPTVMTRRSDINETGLFDTHFPRAEDLELWLRFLAHNKKMHNLQENMVYYRIPEKQFQNRGSLHYRYNYIARKRHSKFIWPSHVRFFSLLGYFVISHVPKFIIESILNLQIANKIKRVEIN